jgi:hypothetical protein
MVSPTARHRGCTVAAAGRQRDQAKPTATPHRREVRPAAASLQPRQFSLLTPLSVVRGLR